MHVSWWTYEHTNAVLNVIQIVLLLGFFYWLKYEIRALRIYLKQRLNGTK
jgi:hypothetical protein